MIVCVCHGISDRHIEALVASGARTPEQVEQACGAGSDCGACRSEVERIVDCAGVCAPHKASQTSPNLILLRARP